MISKKGRKYALFFVLFFFGGLTLFFIEFSLFETGLEESSDISVLKRNDNSSDSGSVSEREFGSLSYREEHDRRLLVKYGHDFIKNIQTKLNDEETMFDALSVIRTHRIYEFVDEMESMLYSNNAQLDRFIVGTLLEFDEDSGYVFLINALKSDRPFEWYALYDSFLENNRRDFIPLLREVSEEDLEGSVLAIRILAALGERVEVKKIVDGIADGFLPDLVAAALKESSEGDAVPYLVRAFEQGKGVDERLNAAWALAAFGRKDYIDYLYKVAEKAKEVPPASLVVDDNLNGEYTTSNIAYKTWIVENYRLNEITKAIDFLVEIERDNVVGMLIQIAELQSKDQPALASHAIGNLAKVGSDKAKDGLLRLYNRNSDIRDSVARALVFFGGDEIDKVLNETYSAEVLDDLRFEAKHLGRKGIYLTPSFY